MIIALSIVAGVLFMAVIGLVYMLAVLARGMGGWR